VTTVHLGEALGVHEWNERRAFDVGQAEERAPDAIATLAAELRARDDEVGGDRTRRRDDAPVPARQGSEEGALLGVVLRVRRDRVDLAGESAFTAAVDP
jgi:hypothetical protein